MSLTRTLEKLSKLGKSEDELLNSLTKEQAEEWFEQFFKDHPSVKALYWTQCNNEDGFYMEEYIVTEDEAGAEDVQENWLGHPIETILTEASGDWFTPYTKSTFVKNPFYNPKNPITPLANSYWTIKPDGKYLEIPSPNHRPEVVEALNPLVNNELALKTLFGGDALKTLFGGDVYVYAAPGTLKTGYYEY